MAVADTESNGTETEAGALAGGAVSSGKSGGLTWTAIWKYAKETAQLAEANGIGKDI